MNHIHTRTHDSMAFFFFHYCDKNNIRSTHLTTSYVVTFMYCQFYVLTAIRYC